MKKINQFITERLKLNKDTNNNHKILSREEFLHFLEDNGILFNTKHSEEYCWDIYLKGAKECKNYYSGHIGYVPSILLKFNEDTWENGRLLNFKNLKQQVSVLTKYGSTGCLNPCFKLNKPDMNDEENNIFEYTKYNALELIRILKEKQNENISN